MRTNPYKVPFFIMAVSWFVMVIVADQRYKRLQEAEREVERWKAAAEALERSVPHVSLR